MRTVSAVLSVLLVAGCARNPALIPVQGDAGRLEGQWYGDYAGLLTGRSGTIEFILSAGADTAQGDVLMIPGGAVPGYGSSVPDPGIIPPAPRFLRIKLVRVFGHQVAGQLDPYEDPECSCLVTTIFSGRLEGNVIEGKFFTYHEGSELASEGRWRVTRRP